ncbi:MULTISPECIES: type II toxin-antitoxin system VapC family toxin [Arthrobacter]|uniref:Type II toxin-antitoxin system VapC family toxin n=1 Tax=Arthrobacter terricola TaxID=2547396 RepID=A0A4R5KIJ2_9MICC|nr:MULTISPECIES: type II toxin-antitoxin system VapC family toxin [Arthrobacter]MBT8162034.1 type II toxin-antitoxin system VapC family toxin [Arthrobacter sp. GN70]TDF94575.1 type II toxin-antitoxin system VapC family toxin [Arthrobacter terricola]
MTEFLLDSNALVLAMTSPDRLSDTARLIIEDLEIRTFASAASAYELAYKYSRGRLAVLDPIMTGYRQHVKRVVTEELSLSAEHALAAASLEWLHRDPFDRMIAAQAAVEGLTLVTSDRALQDFKLVSTIW